MNSDRHFVCLEEENHYVNPRLEGKKWRETSH
jgi:hypothetical protein